MTGEETQTYNDALQVYKGLRVSLARQMTKNPSSQEHQEDFLRTCLIIDELEALLSAKGDNA